MKIEVYADGSANTAKNAGGWGSVILIDGQLHIELWGHLESATNNDAELIAAISGLEYVVSYIKNSGNPLAEMDMLGDVTLISDSEIILSWANGSYRFKQTEKVALYNRLRAAMTFLDAKTQWVRGHSGNTWNERCDKLANNARKKIQTEQLDKVSATGDTRIGTKKSGILSVWYGNQLKVIDLDNNIVENFNRDLHGKRGSAIEIREDKDR